MTAAQRDQQGEIPKLQRDLIRQSGLLALSISQQYGGQGADWLTIFKTIQTIAQVDSSFGACLWFSSFIDCNGTVVRAARAIWPVV